MSKGEQDYVTTSTDYVDKKIGHTMRKRGQLEVNHHSFPPLYPQINHDENNNKQDELHSIRHQIERTEEKRKQKKNKRQVSNPEVDKKTERMLRETLSSGDATLTSTQDPRVHMKKIPHLIFPLLSIDTLIHLHNTSTLFPIDRELVFNYPMCFLSLIYSNYVKF